MNEKNSDSRNEKKFKFCFVSLNAYPYLTNKNVEFSGGAERQQFLLAREMAKHGHNISFIVNDYDQEDIINIGDITVYKYVIPKIKNIVVLFNAIKFLYLWRILGKSIPIYIINGQRDRLPELLPSFACLIGRNSFILLHINLMLTEPEFMIRISLKNLHSFEDFTKHFSFWVYGWQIA